MPMPPWRAQRHAGSRQRVASRVTFHRRWHRRESKGAKAPTLADTKQSSDPFRIFFLKNFFFVGLQGFPFPLTPCS